MLLLRRLHLSHKFLLLGFQVCLLSSRPLFQAALQQEALLHLKHHRQML
jgi:hypothetical protein